MFSIFAIHRTRSLVRAAAAALLAGSMLASAPATAQEAVAAEPSDNAMANLIRALVLKGVLTQAEGDAMIAQAVAEAAQAQSNAAQLASGVPEGAAPGGVRVPYVPQVIQEKIRAEVKAELLAQGKTEGWATPGAVPDWARRIRLSGDLRVRSESRFFDDTNYDGFVNGQLINAGEPFDFNNPAGIPPAIINSTQDRVNRFRVRARLGITAEIDPRVTAFLRIATGDDDSPVSTNDELGGYFTKKDLWLDRAYIDVRPFTDFHVYLGRMANKFSEPELASDQDVNLDLIWDEDVNLDGIAIRSSNASADSPLTITTTAGAFPIDFVDDDGPLPAFSNTKISSDNDAWLYAGQVDLSYDIAPDLSIGAKTAFYYYDNLEGQLSSCFANAPFCLTDYRRPQFAQRGNTLMYLRSILPNPGDPTDVADPQYFGYASKFNVLDLAGRVIWRPSDRLTASLSGDFATNLAYDEAELFARAGGRDNVASNNDRCAVALVDNLCPPGQSIYESGADAWMVRATVGTPALNRWGDWQFNAAYRYVEPDALVDAFADSDFRLGGTNNKGFIVGGALGLYSNTFLSARWLSAEEIFGLPFAVNTLQVDLNVGF